MECCRQGHQFCMRSSCMIHDARRLVPQKDFPSAAYYRERRERGQELTGQISPAAVRWVLGCCWRSQQSRLSYPAPPTPPLPQQPFITPSLSLSLAAPSLCFPPSSPHEMMLLMLLIWELQTQGRLRLSVEVARVGGLRECPAEAKQRAVVITHYSSRRVPSSPGLGRKLTACVLSL